MFAKTTKMKITNITYSLIFLMLVVNTSSGQGIKTKPGTNIIINTSTSLKIVDGDNLIIEDDLTYSPSLLEKGNLTFSGGGELEVQQYLEKDEWHIVSSSVGNETIGAYLDMYLYSYDEPTDVFTNLILPTTIPLNVGEGYFVWSVADAPDYVTHNGTSNNSDVAVSLTVTDATNNSGWNLLGNPFPCVVDWNGNASWAIYNVSPTIYLFDAAMGNYKTWNYITGIGTNGKTNGYIAATQGFWVRTSDTLGYQPTYSLKIPASERVASATTEFYKSCNIEDNVLRILVQKETYSDECVLAFNANATEGFDSDYDAYKLFSNVSSPHIYSMCVNTKLTVNIMNSVEDNEIIPLQFVPGTDGIFDLHIKGIETFAPDLPVYLEDKKDNVFQNLRENSDYTFYSIITDDQDRFAIHFTNPMGINSLPDIMESIQIYAWQNSVIVHAPAGFEGDLNIYDLPGKHIISSHITEGKNYVNIEGAQGLYIVKVTSERGIKTKKVYIH